MKQIELTDYETSYLITWLENDIERNPVLCRIYNKAKMEVNEQ